MLKTTHLFIPAVVSLFCLAGCGEGDATITDVYTFANGCYSIQVGDSNRDSRHFEPARGFHRIDATLRLDLLFLHKTVIFRPFDSLLLVKPNLR